jgi:transposase
MQITDGQWERIRSHFPEESPEWDKRGPKPVPARRILEAVLWILKTGAQWHMLPQSFANYKTVHRRFQQWCESEVLRNILCDLANEARAADPQGYDEAYIDGSFVPSRLGGQEIGYGHKGKGTKIMAIVDRKGLVTAVSAASNVYHEVTLVQLTLDFSLVEVSPEKLIGDKGFDSDSLDEALKQKQIELIAPHKKNRKKLKTQDQRSLQRMKRRFVIERTFAWLKWSRRITSRWDYYLHNFLGFTEIASLQLYLKRI